LTIFTSGVHEGAFGEEVCSADQASGASMDGEGGIVGEQLFFDAGDLEVVV
jgi:hypothetical protein